MIKKFTLALLCFFANATAWSQISYIGILNHNTGTGNNNLFNNYVAVNQDCYIDWEVYAEGMTSSDACGIKSTSRLILRRMSDNDPTSLVASLPIAVDGICGGKNGNNDKFYANLRNAINQPGRYSVEIQADLPGQTDPFGNTSTRTTNNYACPSVYYLSGSGGPTGNYYTPSGVCSGGPGLSDPVGGPSVDRLLEIFPVLKYFTVGEVSTYRQMVVFGGKFYDLKEGKFAPGNPRVPASLDGIGNIPIYGICPVIDAPILSLGGEVNTIKRTDCGNADVTGAALFYRLHKANLPAPAYISLPLQFKDNCIESPNGPEGNLFPSGGSCQNANGILDQRWQTISGVSNILPGAFTLSDTGIWKIQFYTETYMKDCSGANRVQQSTIDSTSFTVNNPTFAGSACAGAVPLIVSSFNVTPGNNFNQLVWKLETVSITTGFEVQRSFNGINFSTIAEVPYSNGRVMFNYRDVAHPGKIVYYRIVIHEQGGKKYNSTIVRVSSKTANVKMIVQPSSQNILVKLESFTKGNYQLYINNVAGSLVAQSPVILLNNGNANVNVTMKSELAHGIYYAVLRDEQGIIVSKTNFYY